MSPTVYFILHVASLLVLTGYTFYAFGAPPETKKKVMIITGIASLVAVIAGFGLATPYFKAEYAGPKGWIFVKLFCWLGLSALAGFGYRRRGMAGTLAAVASVLALIAVITVYTKPF